MRSASQYVSLTSLAISFGALALAIFIYTRRPETISRVTNAFVSRVKEITEPFRLDRSSLQAEQRGRAYLMIKSGDDTNRNPIEILGTNFRLGRNESLAQMLFSDLSVSRLHARISEERDGEFKIYDEGSTSGTYVNYEPIDMQGHWLQHNDIINLGRVELRFKIRSVAESLGEDMEITRPYKPEMVGETTADVGNPQPMRPVEDEEEEGGDTEPFVGHRPEPKDSGDTEPFAGGRKPPA